MSDLIAELKQRVLLCDGAIGSRIQAAGLDPVRDFDGCENCSEILNRTRPDFVRTLHRGYLRAGADLLETNSFGASPITLGEFGLASEALALNRRAAELAREAIEAFAGDGRARYVLGAIGPGTRLPSLGHIDYQSLEDAFALQARGLIEGGVDAILLETCQDPLQIKAAANGAKRAFAESARPLPLFVQLTVETTGTLLVGSDIAAAATVVEALGVEAIGLNCATGPQEMAEHVKWLRENWTGLISVQPNAGLPELVDGHPHYPLAPGELAAWLKRFLKEDGVNLIGGCCGTTDAHIAALDAMLREQSPAARPTPVERRPVWVPGLASLFSQVPLRQERAFLCIGERCNANGSKRFRELQEAQDWDGCVALGREQAREGSHALDLCTAFVGRDEKAAMSELASRMVRQVNAPLVFDSTELPVLEAALKLYGGKPVINSINFEDGEGPAEKRLELARRFGAAVIALTIDEAGMAKDAGHKLSIAKRLRDFTCGRYGLAPSDLLIDPLTFTICTGNEDDRRLGLETLDGIERIAAVLPECQIILGLSNISFGLNPPARHVLNSVFLDHALKRGLTGAILHVSRIVPLHKIAEDEAQAAEDLIFDRRNGKDPLQAFIALFAERKGEARAAVERPEAVEERLKQRIIDGDKQGLEADLEEALQTYAPLDIINTHLLDGMKVVGDLFGAGKMQLPFVLQSAETMKKAVAYLEPLMERTAESNRGIIVLATVKGDVHDIGKNLVDIILTNNGYKVVNLGIRQPVGTVLEAARAHNADAIGLSGLLVKSTVVMREGLEEMTREGATLPVFLGGAALTRAYVEDDCARAYGCGRVAYARDAFDGLNLMGKVMGGSFDSHVADASRQRASRPKRLDRRRTDLPTPEPRPVDLAAIRLKRNELARMNAVPKPPFLGTRVIEEVRLRALLPYLNETMLFQFHWGFKKGGKARAEYRAFAEQEIRPILNRLIETCEAEAILRAQAIYGYFRCAAEGNDLVLFAEDGKREIARFALPRQDKPEGISIADFFRDIDAPERDVIALQVVTVGQRASDVARQWFANDRYQDYLYLHGLSVELAEALAEYVHKRIRAELGFAAEDDRDIEKLLKQSYRGSRYSFGYPACPNLADQRLLLSLLEAQRIGVTMSEGDQLWPEQSTSALITHHPQAKYFNV